MGDIVIRRFDNPDERRLFEKGFFELVTLGGVTIGRAVYEPGWKWTEHVRPSVGTHSCEVEHVGMTVAGRVAISMDSGEYVEAGPGDLFAVPPGHDSWVVGEEPYESLHLLGSEGYAR